MLVNHVYDTHAHILAKIFYTKFNTFASKIVSGDFEKNTKIKAVCQSTDVKKKYK